MLIYSHRGESIFEPENSMPAFFLAYLLKDDGIECDIRKTKDDVCYIFKNGSKIDILAAKESSRGQRRHSGLMEECILIDQTALNEIIIPRPSRLWGLVARAISA